MKHELREYQLRALDSIRGELRAGKKRVVLQAATGSGKTAIAAEMMRCAVAKGKRPLFVADRIELINQTVDRLDAEDIPCGVIQASHPRTDYTKPAQVASIQTLARRKIQDFDLLIYDECHVLHKAHIELLKRWDNVPCIGLSASPWAKGMAKHFQSLIVAATTRELIDLGFLVEPEVYAPSSPDLSRVKEVRGDYDETQLGEATNKPKLVADIVSTWLKHGIGRQTIAFAVNIRHSMAIVEDFKKAGVRAAHLDAYTDTDDRHSTISAFRAGDIQVLSSVDILSKGFDCPAASCAIMARPTKSLMLHVQQQGRVLRPFPGKDTAIILDHAGNTLRLGEVHKIPFIELDDGSKKVTKAQEAKVPLPKKCPKCHVIKPAKAHVCPKCGFSPKTQPLGIEHEQGELIPISEKKKISKITTEGKQRMYAELLGYCRKYGKKDGFAYWLCKDLYGSAPRTRPEPVPPSPATVDMVKYVMIRRNAEKRAR